LSGKKEIGQTGTCGAEAKLAAANEGTTTALNEARFKMGKKNCNKTGGGKNCP